MVVFKTIVLIDLYLKGINMLFYSVFFLFKLFLYLLYTAVVYLFRYGGEGWLGYARGLRLVATLIPYAVDKGSRTSEPIRSPRLIESWQYKAKNSKL